MNVATEPDRWDDLLLADQTPEVKLHIYFKGGSLTSTVRTQHGEDEEREEEQDEDAETDRLKRIGDLVTDWMCKASHTWKRDTWKRMLGISGESVSWQERVILLCRLGNEMRDREGNQKPFDKRDVNKFLMLPDGMVISIQVLQPPFGNTSAIRRFPDLIMLAALDQISEMEQSAAVAEGEAYKWWDDSEVARRLLEILRSWGADIADNSITYRHISGFRERLIKTSQFEDFFPKASGRKKQFQDQSN